MWVHIQGNHTYCMGSKFAWINLWAGYPAGSPGSEAPHTDPPLKPDKSSVTQNTVRDEIQNFGIHPRIPQHIPSTIVPLPRALFYHQWQPLSTTT